MNDVALAPIGILLLVACLIAMLTRRLGLPYIVGLVAAGFLIALLPSSPNLPLSRGLIFNVLLPPLVFEAALQLDWKRFKHELPLTLTLAFAGVAIATLVVAGGMHWIIGWSWIGAALFGVLIAATDPVSVIAAFRELGCLPRVSMVVESESLLNDGVAAVGFAVLSAIAAGASPGAATIIPAFLWTLLGGVGIGLAVSIAILLIVGRTDDPLVEPRRERRRHRLAGRDVFVVGDGGRERRLLEEPPEHRLGAGVGIGAHGGPPMQKRTGVRWRSLGTASTRRVPPRLSQPNVTGLHRTAPDRTGARVDTHESG